MSTRFEELYEDYVASKKINEAKTKELVEMVNSSLKTVEKDFEKIFENYLKKDNAPKGEDKLTTS